MIPEKVCPVVARVHAGELQILAFRHPQAGFQLVKGTIEPGEAPQAAALRELAEEAGLHATHIAADLGLWESGSYRQVWSFQLCEVPGVQPETWVYHTKDGGGHDFAFFWQPLSQPGLPEPCYAVFQRAFAFIRAKKPHILDTISHERFQP